VAGGPGGGGPPPAGTRSAPDPTLMSVESRALTADRAGIMWERVGGRTGTTHVFGPPDEDFDGALT
jgi:hypothetical protein